MALKVVGAGFGRTGTLSLKNALEKIGFGPCYHMMEVFPRPDHVAMRLAPTGQNSRRTAAGLARISCFEGREAILAEFSPKKCL